MINKKPSDEKISVIIPLGGIIPELSRCLDALDASSKKPDEVILVDDSPEGDINNKLETKYKVLHSSMPGGVSAARNTGAFHAREELILFIDSDIVIKPDTIDKIKTSFSDDRIDALVGVQSLDLPLEDFSTQYKNLWMNYTYTTMPDFVPLFYTSCAAIRKPVFLECGGFDRNYKKPSLEDTVFGRRLERGGKKVKLCGDIEVIHLKKYSLLELLITDFKRSAALMKVILRERNLDKDRPENRTSVPASFMWGIIFPPLVTLCLVLFFIVPTLLFIPIFLVFSLLMILFNIKFLSFILKQKGSGFLIKSIAFLHIDYFFVDSGIIWGILSFLSGRRY